MIRRFLTRVLMVVLIGVCAYNVWQIRQMQAQVAALQAQVAQAHRSQTAEAEASAGAQSWLGQAERHVSRARDAVARTDFAVAHRELSLGIADMDRAAQGPEAKTRETVTQTRRTLETLQTQAGDLWKKMRAFRPQTLR